MEVNGAEEMGLHLARAQLARAVTKPLRDHAEQNATAAVAHDLIAGGVAGSAGVFVGHPFDTIKVRMQMSGSGGAALSSSVAQFGGGSGGVGTLFRGIGAPLATAALVNASIFCTFGESSRLWDRHFGSQYGSSSLNGSAIQKPFTCGAFAGLITSLIICPTEHVKVRLQTQRSGGDIVYRDSLDAARKIFNSHGIRGMYRGMCATCCRQGPAFAIYFASYDRVKELGQRVFGKDSAASTPTRQGGRQPIDSGTWMASIMAGGIAGSLAWAAVYPMDLIKSRVQSIPLTTPKRERSLWHLAKGVVIKDGWRALYRGLGITLVRAFPVNGIIFPVYEVALMMLTDADIAERSVTPEMI